MYLFVSVNIIAVFIWSLQLCFAYAMVTNHLRAPYGVYFTKIDSTEPVRRQAGGRKNRTIFIIFLDIVRCPVKFRYYLKFHSARTAFAHIGRAPDNFCLKFISYDSNGARRGIVRCPAGHRSMSDKRRELSTISLQIGRSPSGHWPMFYKSNRHR